MTTTQAHPITGKTVSRWGTCPVCFKERRTQVISGVMKPHRKWVKFPPYGFMTYCEGTKQMPLAPIPTEEKENGNVR